MNVCQVIFALLSSVLSIDAISPELPHDTDWPTLYFKNGETAKIPCTPYGEAEAYFWRRGESYNVSEDVAYNTRGFTTNSTKYRVLFDGYLFIDDFSSSDQGRYFCRTLSDTNECYGTVNIYLKVTKQELDISIVQCNPLPSCEIHLKRSSTYSLTCMANLLSPKTEIVWSNGTETVSNEASVVIESDSPQPTISSTIMLTYSTASYITCKAIDAKLEDNSAGVLLLDLDEESSHKKFIFLIITSVVLAVICVIFATFIILVLRNRRKLVKEQKAATQREENTSLMASQQKSEINRLKTAKQRHEENEKRYTSQIDDLEERILEHEKNIAVLEKDILAYKNEAKRQESNKKSKEYIYEKREVLPLLEIVQPLTPEMKYDYYNEQFK